MKREIWHWFKTNTPPGLRAALDNQVLRLAYRPTQDEVPSPLEKTVVVLSADFELAWAWRYASGGIKQALDKAKIERAQTPRLLRLLDETRIPITWATVGMLADETRGRGHGPIPTLPAYECRYWKFPGGDPFAAVAPGLDLNGPDWYAPDLIEQILAAKAGHEIASHSFGHHDTTDANSPKGYFSWELAATDASFKKFGVKPTSFVFPGNLPGNHDLLEKFGYTCVRHFPWDPQVELAAPRRIRPRLWGMNQSVCIEAYGFDAGYVGRKTQSLLKKSVGSKRVVSLWFHPSLDHVDYEQSFEPVVRLCAKLRDRGDIEVLTMKQLADRMSSLEKK
jgi:peptidoglycan/xylan/chitin deacetylase (PgdA/CDA1 family)